MISRLKFSLLKKKTKNFHSINFIEEFFFFLTSFVKFLFFMINRFAAPPLTFGKKGSDPNFLRFGRTPSNNFLRFGKSNQAQNFLRFGRNAEPNFLRFGKY